MTIINKKNIYKLVILLVVSLAIYFIVPNSLPLIFAWLTALLLTPIVKLLKNKTKLSHNLSVFITFSLFLILISYIGYFTVTKVMTQINNLIKNLPQIINQITASWLRIQQNFQNKFEDLPQDFVREANIQVMNYLNNLRDQVGDLDLIGIGVDAISSVPSFLISFLVFLIALYFFLLELPVLKEKFYSIFTDETAEKIRFMYTRFTNVITGFFKAQIIVSIPIFLASLIGLLLIKPDIALLMAIIIWIIDIIPLIGSILVTAPWVIFTLIVGDIPLAIQLSILAVVLLIIRRGLEPKIMGQQIGLSPLATLIAIFLGLKLFGAMGLLIGPLILIAFKSAQETKLIKWKKI